MGPWGYAGCHYCPNEPLVSTFAFYKKEFICLGCGRTYEFLNPKSLGESDEIKVKSEAREQEWKENAGRKLLTANSCFTDCELCDIGKDEYHHKHATEQEWEEHNKAIEWLSARTGRDFSSYLREGVKT